MDEGVGHWAKKLFEFCYCKQQVCTSTVESAITLWRQGHMHTTHTHTDKTIRRFACTASSGLAASCFCVSFRDEFGAYIVNRPASFM